MINDTILVLDQACIIEQIPDTENFIADNPTCNFLVSMPVSKLSKETIK